MNLEKIEIEHELDFDELEERLRNVRLRGFPDVKIYANSEIKIKFLSPDKIKREIFTPQPSIYKPILDKVAKIDELFSEQGIDIFYLQGGFDYVAFSDNETTEWTIIPPVIEVLPIRFNLESRLDYSDSIGTELKALMDERGYALNPELQNLSFPVYEVFRGQLKKIPVICDGSHRIEFALRQSLEQNILFINSPLKGFPYYAAPKPISCIHQEPERIEEKIDKTHVLTEPGHKLLYRLFPSGGINSGNVRSLKKKYD